VGQKTRRAAAQGAGAPPASAGRGRGVLVVAVSLLLGALFGVLLLGPGGGFKLILAPSAV